jgi:hypothetical protein
MTRNGFKRAVVLGLAASALMLAGGCRDQQGKQGPQYVPSQQDQGQGTGGAGAMDRGQQPVDVNPQKDQEGMKTVPEQQELPSGIQREDEGQGGSGRSEDINKLPDEEGFQSVPERQELPDGVGSEGQRDTHQHDTNERDTK